MSAPRIALLAACVGLGGCLLERADQERTPNPAAGLYTPGSMLGAGDPSDLLPSIGALGDRCQPPGAIMDERLPYSTGTLSLSYQTQTVDAQYAPANATAVWVEDANDAYVATLEINASLRLPGLRHLAMRACDDERGPDVITSASLEDHQEPHEGIRWSGRDFAGNAMPDGEYRLYIEITETDKADGDCLDYVFTKGPMPYVQELPVDGDSALLQATLTWEVDGAAAPVGLPDGGVGP